jgi:CelD/BcsL family acetyltransferase involved in cellulose biosynthesis
MRVEIVDPRSIAGDLAARWEQICADTDALSSPYFTLPFVQTIARHRPNTFVAVIDDGAAFFPFQREAFDFGIGRPIGSPISDYHGVISPTEVETDIRAVLRRSGLVGWEFNHVPAAQTSFGPWAHSAAASPTVDLPQWTGGSSSIREQAGRKLRKLQREVGEVEFEFDCRDEEMLDLCLKWKLAQYQRSEMYNILTSRDGAWIRASLREIHRMRETGFSGCLSVLKAAGRPVAAHFGMRSRTDLHYWFPAYDVEFGAYSPGISLLLKMAEAAAAAGLSRLDLGRGDAVYKERVATGTIPLLEGRVVVQPMAFALLDARKQLAQSARRLLRRSKAVAGAAAAAPAG